MRYITLITRGKSKAELFADALSGSVGNASVYVVGLDDVEALADALTGELGGGAEHIAEAFSSGIVTITTDLDARMQLKFTYVEAVGTEDYRTPIEFLLSTAKNLAAEIEKAGGHQEHKKLTQRFSGRSA